MIDRPTNRRTLGFIRGVTLITCCPENAIKKRKEIAENFLQGLSVLFGEDEVNGFNIENPLSADPLSATSQVKIKSFSES